MKKILLTLSMILGFNTTLMAELTQSQLDATLGIVTNFSLDDDITFRGKNYKSVTSPYTGRTWLDRNLGADRVCTSIDDAQCYGDYYQWGRAADGHQESNSSTVDTLATDVSSVGHSSFITTFSSPFDWASVDAQGISRAADWSVVDGSSICPSGFRVPTFSELSAELLDSSHASGWYNSDAFDSFLKLPSTGFRTYYSGTLTSENILTFVWSSSVDGTSSRYIQIDGVGISHYFLNRAVGASVRCIKSTTPADTMPPVINITGGSTDIVLLNDNYADAGAVAVDNVDVNLTVTSLGTVDTTTLGDYNITYTAVDSAGNVGRAVKTVSVVDTITRNGITYGLVVSPYTNVVWLDRNLGASRVCTSYNDAQCYGDYYQWGRHADGHEDSNSSISTTLATDVSNVGHGNYITNITISTDWTSIDSNGSIRSANWSKTDGTAVCPTGFRVPTLTELSLELFATGSANISNRDDAYASFLKLPSSGIRYVGNMYSVGSWGLLWSSSVYDNDTTMSNSVSFDDTSAYAQGVERAIAIPVRCRED